MKIAIVTLIGEFNNGNRLQNYALQESLKKVSKDISVDTINLNVYNNVLRKAKKILKTLLKRNINLKAFRKFNKNITFTNKKYNEIKEDYKLLINEYDYFVTGSDQVWNLGYLDNEKYYFLDWVPCEKKLSYAASIGNNNLTEIQQAKFLNLLSTFNQISVREKESEEMLNKLGFNNVDTHIDPTLMLTEKEWNKLVNSPKYNFTKDYIFVCILGQMSEEYKQTIQEIANKYNLEIINLYDKKNKEIFSSGPSEFLYLIKNAKLVITDSFHSIVFSITFKTPFLHFERCDTGASAKINSRLKNLERIFETKFKTHKNIDDNIFDVIIPNPDEKLKIERQKSLDYLKNALSNKKINNLNDTKFKCTGCGLCANICPQKAIKIVQNDKGFYHYEIDSEKCNNCGACIKLCPANNTYSQQDYNITKIYGAKNHFPIQDNSSSAGVFGKLASKILNDKGIVYGLSYNQTNEYSRIDKLEDLEKIKGSKYYQANISTIYPLIEKDLKENKEVLICGTPCQIAGLKQKFKNYSNIYLIGIICHGTPSKKILQEYCIEEFGEIPTKINFRKKNPYWQNYNLEFIGKNYNNSMRAFDNIWFKNFISNTYLNNCCYNCNFAGKDFGADIILGDFWGIENIDKKFYDKYGTSIVICSSEKGSNLIQSIDNQIITKEYHNINQIIPYNPCLIKTNYGKNKEYTQELFYVNRKNKLSFKENVNATQKFMQQNKAHFIKRALRKLKRIVFKK